MILFSSTNTFWTYFCGVFTVIAFVKGKAIDNDLFRLHIVHYNDFHARFEETSVDYAVCTTNDTACLGGFPRLYHEIITLKKWYPDALVLDAGDCFQGTYWYTILKWNVTKRFINMLPNDAHALGNHEFDDGIKGLAPYLESLNAPVLAANLDTSEEPAMEGLYQPHVIVERNGRKIGIIGVITNETQTTSNPGKAIFTDPVSAVKMNAELLKERGVDIIIVLSHCGLDVDKSMARTVGENIDIIVGGHTHSLLWNGKAPSKEKISGPYPELVKSETKPDHNVLIVTASAFTKYLGNITVYFDKHGEIHSFDGTPIFLNRSIPEDKNVKEILDHIKEILQKEVDEVVGYSNEEMRVEQCAHECTLGNLVADGFLYLAKQNPSNLSDIALVLRNNMRISIPKGEITRGTIINVLPHTNKVVSFTFQGRYLLEVLERTMKSVWNEKPFTGPWIPHVAGMKVTLNTTSREVVSVLVKEGDEYKALDHNKDYRIITLDFFVRGGNGFTMIKHNHRDYKELGIDSKVLEGYVNKISPITPSELLDNRLVIVN